MASIPFWYTIETIIQSRKEDTMMISGTVRGIKADLIEHFRNRKIKYCYFCDEGSQKRIDALFNSKNKNVIKMTIFPQENTVQFNLFVTAVIVYGITDTYDSELGIAFSEWFKPILRSLVCKKYFLGIKEVITDELSGTDYCQVRTDGILPFVNLTENQFFT